MIYTYKPRGVCSTKIEVELDGHVIKGVQFTGGCRGNLQAISRLVAGMTVEEAAEKLEGIRCGGKPTSCSDQFILACREALASTEA